MGAAGRAIGQSHGCGKRTGRRGSDTGYRSGTAGCWRPRERPFRAAVGAREIRISELPPSAQNQSAYDVVQQYKSSWLRGRGRSSINAPQEVSVYLDSGENRYGGPESLKSISARDVESIERLSSQEAQFQFGMDNTQGVILVHMKDGS
jgi:hypothetical protein